MAFAEFRVSWSDFDGAVSELARALEPMNDRRRIFGQPRGGLPLAVALSHRLHLPIACQETGMDRLIWVDDLIDTGNTYTLQRMRLPADTIFCAWFAKGEAQGAFVHTVIENGDHPVFPWERA